ncbi:MAG: Ppx/GppA phosphatase family protein [Hyphomicrobiaceae bacterium]|nr:Ppx/GppA phosphatase family protein [Hyphomicrobiaceae bacterium]
MEEFRNDEGADGAPPGPHRDGPNGGHADPVSVPVEAGGSARQANASGAGRTVSAPAQPGPAHRSTPAASTSQPVPAAPPVPPPVYGALDLGTNNCRLLLAKPSRRGFRVVDAFSRIIRLGEGVGQTGRLSPEAMARTMEALRICAEKLKRADVRRSRLVATEACRLAGNAPEFLAEVKARLDLDIEILTPEAEARLAVSGCISLADPEADFVLVFDIGGGSSELAWLDLSRGRAGKTPSRTDGRDSAPPDRIQVDRSLVAWTSLPVGVVTLAERFGGQFVTPAVFDAMVAHVAAMLDAFEARHGFRARTAGRKVHLLGTSGTVTTVAGIQMGLQRYDRNRVDGSWLSVADARHVTQRLLGQTYEQRIAEPCIGRDRADLVLAGCAILEAVLATWPCERLRVADRGLREGILSSLMHEDGAHRSRRRRHGRRR